MLIQDESPRHRKIGLVLLNMGGPKTLDDVRPFLYNLFADPDIINLPWFVKPFQKPLAWLIAKTRSPQTIEMYRQIGNGSPILEITDKLGKAIEEEFKEKYPHTIATVAMRYTFPRAQDAIEVLHKADVDTIILFSQYPHYAESTTGSSLRDFYAQLQQSTYEPKDIIEIDEWGTEPEYINWWVTNIRQTLTKVETELSKNVHLIFTAHGLPQRYVDAGETYPDRIREAADLIAKQLTLEIEKISYHVSFQSQAGPVEWTRPYTDQLLDELAEQGAKAVILVPLGFVSNHVETLYEIDILYKGQATDLGIPEFHSVPVPDADPKYARGMKDMILRKVEGVLD